MLPGINSQQRHILPRHRVLIWQRHNLQLLRLLILHEPAPPAPLDASKRCIHHLLERIIVAPGGIDGLCKRAARGSTSATRLGREVLPEKRVVQMSSTHTAVIYFCSPPSPSCTHFGGEEKKTYPPWNLNAGCRAICAVTSPACSAAAYFSSASLSELTYVWWCLEWCSC